ncbi:MAG: biotin attachment protein [Lentisphaerae bacterium]|nr:biotin attachment protein [Lentisphaerota bacterium]
MGIKKIKFMCTAFRDGFQSAYGARVLTSDFLPAVEAASEAGISHFEAGGGARFQSLFFYCNENAFDMMDAFRQTAGPNANLQTLARGVNVVGLDSQPSDVISLHAKLFKKHGITTIRNFDALNDVNNLVHSGQAIVDAGLKHQVCVTMMELPPGCTGAHGPDFYTEVLQKILKADIPFDSVCFKDASGTSVPSKVYETIKRARKLLPEGMIIQFHTHDTAGIGVSCNREAIAAGADIIDLSLAPCSGGTCQPDVLTMWHALRGSEYTLDVDVDKVREAEEVFKECMKYYFLPPEATAVEPLIPWSPMPGGALTANTQMLRDNGIMDKFPEIIKAMGDVVRAGGYGTSVTPVSQFYFQQAFNNVMFGPWEKIAEGYGQMVLGYFGKTPVSPDPMVVKLASEQLMLEPTTRPPLELNDEDPTKGLNFARKLLKAEGLDDCEENVFIVATCKEKGLDFLKGKATLGIRKIDPAKAADASAPPEGGAPSKPSGTYTVSVSGHKYAVTFDDNHAHVNGKSYVVDLKKGGTPSGAAAPKPTPAATPAPAAAAAPVAVETSGADLSDVTAPMPGVVIKITAEAGTHVNAGDPVLVLEAMKMEMKVNSPVTGTVAEICISKGAQVASGQVLAKVGA